MERARHFCRPFQQWESGFEMIYFGLFLRGSFFSLHIPTLLPFLFFPQNLSEHETIFFNDIEGQQRIPGRRGFESVRASALPFSHKHTHAHTYTDGGKIWGWGWGRIKGG